MSLTEEERQVVERALEILERRLRRGSDLISGPAAALDFCKLALAGHDREVFGALFLDNRHRLIAFEILFMGTVDGAEVHVREVARRALEHNAAALIVTHNHPSGEPEPSAADISITEKLHKAMTLLGIRLLDHVVVAGNRAVSLAERGVI